MLDALQIAATGMQTQKQHVDTIANNLANVNTSGFKRASLSFSELMAPMASSLPASATVPRGDDSAALQPSRGNGVSVGQVTYSFEAGEAKKTDAPMDVMVSGDGFLELQLPDGGFAYTRGGTLQVDANGYLSSRTGYVLKPGIRVPGDVQTLTIATDGRVLASTARRPEPSEIGRLELVRFTSTANLEPLGDDMFKANERAGEPISGRAGEDGMGTLRQGFLESSNVKLVDEMVSLMVAQRAYEASVKVVQTADELFGMVNNLRK